MHTVTFIESKPCSRLQLCAVVLTRAVFYNNCFIFKMLIIKRLEFFLMWMHTINNIERFWTLGEILWPQNILFSLIQIFLAMVCFWFSTKFCWRTWIHDVIGLNDKPNADRHNVFAARFCAHQHIFSRYAGFWIPIFTLNFYNFVLGCTPLSTSWNPGQKTESRSSTWCLTRV